MPNARQATSRDCPTNSPRRWVTVRTLPAAAVRLVAGAAFLIGDRLPLPVAVALVAVVGLGEPAGQQRAESDTAPSG